MISIITPSLNQGQFIEQSIRSVLDSGSVEVELIILDGGSDDNTTHILEKYDDKIDFWVSEHDTGQSNAINKGISRAKGNIVNWLNSDDYYEPRALEIIQNKFGQRGINVVLAKSRLFSENQTVSISTGTDVYPNNLAKTIGWSRIDQPESFFTKTAWDTVGLLNEQLHYTMDREWWMRYLYEFGLEGIQQIQDVVVNFRLHADSKTVGQPAGFQVEHDTLFYLMAKAAKNNAARKVIKENCQIDENLRSSISEWTKTALAQMALNYYILKRADEFYYQGDHRKSRNLLKCIESNLLDTNDATLYKGLKWKSLLPETLIRIAKKTR